MEWCRLGGGGTVAPGAAAKPPLVLAPPRCDGVATAPLNLAAGHQGTWKIWGVVRLLKVMVLVAMVSVLKRPRNWLTTVVWA